MSTKTKSVQSFNLGFNLGMLEQGLTLMETDHKAATAEELREEWERSMQLLVIHVGTLYQRYHALTTKKQK